MSPKFSQSFKKQAVEKALNRQDNTTLKEVADSLGVGLSSLTRWTRLIRPDFSRHFLPF